MLAMSGENSSSKFRREVRAKALTSALVQLETMSWSQIRIGKIAQDVGVSRPTIYAEFGNKDGLGEALIMAEALRFLAGVTDILQQNSSQPARAVELSISFTLTQAAKSPVLRAILTGPSSGSDSNSLLPFVTTRGAPVMRTSNQQLLKWFRQNVPDVPRQRLMDAIDVLIRLVVSNLLVPDRRPKRTSGRLAGLAVLMIPELEEGN
jgi:AcrR family transcriptional regulator